MDAFLRVLLTNATAAGVLALAVWVAARVVRRPTLVHALWLLALGRLLAPPLIPLPILAPPALGTAAATTAKVSGGDLLGEPAAETRGATASRGMASSRGSVAAVPDRSPQMIPRESRASLVTPAGPAAGGTERAPSGPAVPRPGQAPLDARALGEWVRTFLLLGAGGVLALSIFRQARFAGLIRHAEPAPVSIAERASTLARRLGLRRAPSVRVLPARLPPLLVPTLQGPLLLLPRDLLAQLSEQECDTLLVHELAHVRRRDHWVRLLEIVATALFWWDPLAWWTRRSLRRAEELCCDEWVLRVMPGSARVYASGLLKAATLGCVEPSSAPIAASATGAARELAARLEEVLMDRPSARTTVPARFAFAVVAMLALPLFPTRGGSHPQQASPSRSTEMRNPPASPASPSRPQVPPPSSPQEAASTSIAVAPGDAAQPPSQPAAALLIADPVTAVVDETPITEPAVWPAAKSGADAVSPATREEAWPAAPPAVAQRVVRISAERIDFDAVVTDKKHRHVTDLTPADLELLQDGKRQAITRLTYVRVGSPAAAARDDSSEPAGGTSSLAGRTILFVVDDASLSLRGFDDVRRALGRTIARLSPSDRTAVIATQSGLARLPDSDRAPSLERIAGLRRTTPGPLEVDQLVLTADQADVARARRAAGALDSLDVSIPLSDRFGASLRTLRLLVDATQALRELPGRKAIVLVCEGLYLPGLSRLHADDLYATMGRGQGDTDDLRGVLRRFTDFAARAGVVIEVAGPRGLVTTGPHFYDHTLSNTEERSLFAPLVEERVFREHPVLESLADATGGRARLDVNDVESVLNTFVEDAAGYYIVSYAPPSETFGKAAYHSLELKARRRGLDVRTRKGFYGVGDASALP